MKKYPIGFKPIEDEPKYRALRRVKDGKLGQKVLRDISKGMSPKAFDEYATAMGDDFKKAVEAIRTQDARSNVDFMRAFAETVWLFAKYKDCISWSRYPCLFPNSPCFLCHHRSCGRSAGSVVLELLEREHCRQLHKKEDQATERNCPLHLG